MKIATVAASGAPYGGPPLKVLGDLELKIVGTEPKPVCKKLLLVVWRSLLARVGLTLKWRRNVDRHALPMRALYGINQLLHAIASGETGLRRDASFNRIEEALGEP